MSRDLDHQGASLPEHYSPTPGAGKKLGVYGQPAWKHPPLALDTKSSTGGSQQRMVNHAPVTDWLEQWRQGDAEALDRVFTQVYDDLRSTARRYLANESDPGDLQPTALVNELWMELTGLEKPRCENRKQFFVLAASIIRHFLVDAARRRGSQKRGSNPIYVSLTAAADLMGDEDFDAEAMLDVHRALQELERMDERLASLVELRFFAGLTVEEVVVVSGRSRASLNRDWKTAKAWIVRRLKQGWNGDLEEG